MRRRPPCGHENAQRAQGAPGERSRGRNQLSQMAAATRPGRRGDPGARDPHGPPQKGGWARRCVEGKSAPGDPENREAQHDGAPPGCGGQSDEAQVAARCLEGDPRTPSHGEPFRMPPGGKLALARPKGRLGAGRVQEEEGPTRPDDRRTSQLAECLAGVNVSLPGRPGPEGRTLPGRRTLDAEAAQEARPPPPTRLT